MRKNRTVGLVILALLLLTHFSQAQNFSKSDSEIVKLADKSFDKGDYKEAGTLYAQLVSVNSNDALFNYRFGVCALKTDRKNVLRPIKYLKYAADNLIEKEDVYYYLGIAYHNNMKFSEAIEAFQNYTSVIINPTPLSEDADQRITYCENGLKLNKSNLVRSTINTVETDQFSFYKTYNINHLGCNLILKPEILKSDISKSNAETELAFISAEKDYVYFSDIDATGKRDLYRSAILQSGGFGAKEKLQGSVNTSMDENYPVVLDQGKTLYFSSKGHNSMGGYDIFKSTLNEANGEWSNPVNLDYEINTPFDDVLFIEDKTQQSAWYASNRKSAPNKITIFNVKINPFKKDGTETGTVVNGTKDQVPGTTVKTERDKKINDRMKAGKLADSAYMIVGLMEKQIRSLTNSRDRANRLSKTKKETTQVLSDEISASCKSLLNVSDEEMLMSGLKAANSKDEVFQTTQKQSARANAISTVLGQQISIKRSELAIIKKDASGILSASTTKSLQETEQLYSGFIKKHNEADTLSNFSEDLNLISQNEMKFDLAESELFTNLNVYLQNHVKIENLKKTASSDQLQSMEIKSKEARVLMELAINNRNKAVKESSVLQQGYYLKDAQTFEETAINQQLEILKSTGQKVASNYKSPPVKKDPPQSKVVVAAKQTKPAATNKTNSKENRPTGVVYRVQLGAFSSSPSAEKLKGIDPITTEQIPGKSIVRYFGGQFNNKDLADNSCVQYKQNGFTDAFVVAFNNGKRINLAEAKKLLSINSDQIQEIVTKINPSKQKEQKAPVVNSKKTSKIDGVKLKVQLAALREQKTKSWNDDLSNKVGTTIEEIHLSSGVYIYATGSFTNYSEASEFLKSVKAKGYNDAFLIGVNAGEKIPVAKAIELLK